MGIAKTACTEIEIIETGAVPGMASVMLSALAVSTVMIVVVTGADMVLGPIRRPTITGACPVTAVGRGPPVRPQIHPARSCHTAAIETAPVRPTAS